MSSASLSRPKPAKSLVHVDLAYLSTRMTARQQQQYLMSLSDQSNDGRAPLGEMALHKPNKETPLPDGRAKRTSSTESVTAYQLAGDHNLDDGLQLVRGDEQAELSGEPLAALKAYKLIADDLLPDMRRDSHLHNLVFSRSSQTLVLSDDEDCVVGGATFRLLEVGTLLVLNVLVVVVDQHGGVCRRGYGSLIIDALKGVLAHEVVTRHPQGQGVQGAQGMLLAQCDDGVKATAFWEKQKLRASMGATQLLQGMADADERLVPIYEGSTPMMFELPLKSVVKVAAARAARATSVCEPAPTSSGRSQASSGQLDEQMRRLSLRPR